MTGYVARRTAFVVVTVLVSSAVVFGITQVLPGDIARVILGREAGESALAALRADLGLDRPWPYQYFDWLMGLLRGDWGTSYSTGVLIACLAAERLGKSLRLAAVTLVMTVPLAIGLGAVAGLRAGSLFDAAISVGALAVVGLPEFVTGLVLVQLFAFRWSLLPASSAVAPGASLREAFPQLILPGATASLVLVAYVARLTRAGVVEELGKAYVTTAVLKGLPWRVVVFRHVLRNALAPTVTVVAISLGWLVSGLIVVENVFNYPGLGRLLTFAIDRRDVPLMQAIAIATVIVYAMGNLVADTVYAVLDPRVQLR